MRSAVRAGHGVTFISRSADRVRPRRRDGRRRAASKGSSPRARSRSSAPPAGRRRGSARRVRRVRARAARVTRRDPVRRRHARRAGRGRRGGRHRAAAARDEPARRGARRSGCPWRPSTTACAGTFRSRRSTRRPTAAEDADADGLVGLGGGSAIDLCKAATLALRDRGRTVRTIAIPTTYAGAEWTSFFGVRDEAARTKRGGSDDAARPVAAIYDPELTLEPPARRDRRHGAERARALRRGALRARAAARAATATRSPARARSRTRCRRCSTRPRLDLRAHAPAGGRDARGAGARRGRALRSGTRWRRRSAGAPGLPHGALNAICLPPALRFNEPVVPEAIAKLADAMRRRRRGRARRGARPARRLRAPARPRRARGRAGRDRGARRGAAGSAGEPAPGERRRRSPGSSGASGSERYRLRTRPQAVRAPASPFPSVVASGPKVVLEASGTCEW